MSKRNIICPSDIKMNIGKENETVEFKNSVNYFCLKNPAFINIYIDIDNLFILF